MLQQYITGLQSKSVELTVFIRSVTWVDLTDFNILLCLMRVLPVYLLLRLKKLHSKLHVIFRGFFIFIDLAYVF